MITAKAIPDAGFAAGVHTLSLLLVEDSDGDSALLEASLAEACTGSPLHPFVAIRRARSLADAIRELTVREPDVILLDLGLPDSTGLESLKAMRAACDLPIVVLTGLADERVALEAAQHGAQDYLFKGEIEPGVTLRALRYAIERKQQEGELARTRWRAGIGDTVLAVLHEINNPLTSLLMNAEMLSAGDRDARTIEAIGVAAGRIAEVTRRLSRQQLDPRTVEYVKGMRMLDLR